MIEQYFLYDDPNSIIHEAASSIPHPPKYLSIHYKNKIISSETAGNGHEHTKLTQYKTGPAPRNNNRTQNYKDEKWHCTHHSLLPFSEITHCNEYPKQVPKINPKALQTLEMPY